MMILSEPTGIFFFTENQKKNFKYSSGVPVRATAVAIAARRRDMPSTSSITLVPVLIPEGALFAGGPEPETWRGCAYWGAR